jgi:hypothetical protein
MKDYYFDLCTTNGVVQLTALNTYIGARKLLAGSDCQYILLRTRRMSWRCGLGTQVVFLYLAAPSTLLPLDLLS